MASTAFPTRDDFAALLNESLGGEKEGFEGRVVTGIVTAIENDMAVIDVGLKSEGRVPLREFAAPGQKPEIKVGDEVEVYVDRVENANGEAMLSRDRARREAAWDKLEKEFEKGERVEGVIFGRVKNITDYGAFVDLGGIDGLLHVTDISYKRVNHPSELINIGDTVKVQIIRINRETQRISFGLKQAEADPWEAFAAAHPVGTEVEGEVKNATEFGLFVGLDGDVDGMVHMSDIAWGVTGEEALNLHRKGETVKAVVLDVDVEKERISLGMKQLERGGVAKGGTAVAGGG